MKNARNPENTKNKKNTNNTRDTMDTWVPEIPWLLNGSSCACRGCAFEISYYIRGFKPSFDQCGYLNLNLYVWDVLFLGFQFCSFWCFVTFGVCCRGTSESADFEAFYVAVVGLWHSDFTPWGLLAMWFGVWVCRVSQVHPYAQKSTARCARRIRICVVFVFFLARLSASQRLGLSFQKIPSEENKQTNELKKAN